MVVPPPQNPSLNSAGNIDMIDISIRFFCHGESNMGEAQEDALKQDSLSLQVSRDFCLTV